MWTLQIIEPYKHYGDAREALKALSMHAGFLGGNYGEQGDGFYIQAFFRAPGSTAVDGPRMTRLPDGAKLVFVPALLQKWYGFTEAN